MSNPIKIDSHEPAYSEALFKQVLGQDNVITAPLNSGGWGDYIYNGYGGALEQVERKQANEILSSLEDVEYQLGNHIFNHPEGRLILLIEGIIHPTPTGIQTYKLGKNGKYFGLDRYYHYPYKRYENWRVDLERKGVLIWTTTDYLSTVHSIISMYETAQKAGSSVLERHLKVRGVQQPKPDDVKVREEEQRKQGAKVVKPWKPNPYVQMLIQMPGSGFGVELSERAIEIFGTPWDLLRSEPEIIADYLPGVSITKAKQLLRAAGRDV